MSYYHVGPCASNPCKNGGTCSVKGRTTKKYQCKCKNGYYGKMCDGKKKGKYVYLKYFVYYYYYNIMQQHLIGSVSKIRTVYKMYATYNVPLRDNDLNLCTTHQAVHVYTWMHKLISDNLFYLTIKGNIPFLTILKKYGTELQSFFKRYMN